MISICIPIYNFHVENLVLSLLKQIKSLEESCEIILIDDCSDEKYKGLNKLVGQKADLYLELEKNIGRAAIRNKFLEFAKYNYLLFLDCDSIIHSDTFLKKYLFYVYKNSNKLICGGRCFKNIRPERQFRLRWKYGLMVESQPVFIRNKNPNKSFMSNNFLIPKSIFENVKFDEWLVDYGHEDTLFGFRLKIGGFEIAHIDNPTLNGDLEDNITYITKTETAIKNLVEIIKFINSDNFFINSLSLTKTYSKLGSFKIFIRYSFLLLKPIIKSLLKRGYVDLNLFAYYKLAFFDSIVVKKRMF